MQVKNITLYFMQMYKKAVIEGHYCIYITFIFIFLRSHQMLIIFYFFLLCCLPITSVFQHWRKRENILKENLFKNQTLSIFNSFLFLFVSSKIESKFNNSHNIIGQFVFLICSKKNKKLNRYLTIRKENLFKNQTLSIFNSFLFLFVSSKIESKFNNSHNIIGQFVFLIYSKKTGSIGTSPTCIRPSLHHCVTKRQETVPKV